MLPAREIEDSLESVLGIYFSDIRHRARAAFILCDELVEMACKVRARQCDHKFDFHASFNAAWNSPHVALDPDGLGSRVQASRNTRNNMQHASAAATVDDQHCADAILDAVEVVEHLWPGASESRRSWMKCALRVVRLHSSDGDAVLRAQFEDQIRRHGWRGEERRPRRNEMLIEPGRRAYWQVLLTQSPADVDQILDEIKAN